MNPSLAYTVLAMQKAAQTPPVNNSFLPMAGAGVGYMMGDGDMTDRLLPAGIGYFLANAYNNMTPEQRANLFAKSPELAQQAQQAQQASVGTIPEVAPGAAGAPDVHAKIRPSNLPANATLHHVQVGNNTQGVWKVVGADGTQQLFDSGGKMLQQGSPVYTQAAAQIQSGQAPATYAGLPENVRALPTGLQTGAQTITTQSGTYQVEKLVDKNGKPIVDKNGIQKAKFYRVDASGALVGDLTQSELADANRAYSQGQAKITPAPKMTPGRGYIETGRGEWYNPKTQDVRVLDPKQGLVSVQPGNPDYDRIRNTASGIPQGAKEHINPLTGQKIMVVPDKVTPGVTGVSSPTVESYRAYEIDKTKPGWQGKEITNPYARQTINAELVADYNKPQTQSLTEEYRRLEATKPLPRDYAKAKLGDPESIAKIREHELAVANARTKDININRGAAQPKSFKGNFFGKPVEIKNPLRTVESRMNLGSNIGKATGAIGGFAGGAMLGGMAGKGIANALGGEDDQEFGAITGSILGGLAGGYGGFKGGERFIGRPLGDSLGQRGPGGATNKLGETIDSKLLTKSRRFPVGRTLLGLGGAAIAANYFKDWLDKDFDKNETTPARAGIDLSRWMPR